jgi:hypothetical protein
MTLSQQQIKAREEFDLEKAMSSLPALDAYIPPPKDHDSIRLREYLKSDISDDLLREFATTELKAERLSKNYLNALRIILGNKAHAEKNEYKLQLNTRTSFASQRTMRTILGQMFAAGLLTQEPRYLGNGRIQDVYFYETFTPTQSMRENDPMAAEVYAAMCRRREKEAIYADDSLDLDAWIDDIPY